MTEVILIEGDAQSYEFVQEHNTINYQNSPQ